MYHFFSEHGVDDSSSLQVESQSKLGVLGLMDGNNMMFSLHSGQVDSHSGLQWWQYDKHWHQFTAAAIGCTAMCSIRCKLLLLL